MIPTELAIHKFFRTFYFVIAIIGATLFIYALIVEPRWNYLLASLLLVAVGLVGANDERRAIRQINGMPEKLRVNAMPEQNLREKLIDASSQFVAHANKLKMCIFMAPVLMFYSISSVIMLSLTLALLVPQFEPPPEELRTLGIIVFSISLPITLMQAQNYLSHFRADKPVLIINDIGLDFAWYGLIPWSQILAIELDTRYMPKLGQLDSLLLTVESPSLYRDQMPWLRRKKYKKNDPTGILDIDLHLLKESTEDIFSAAQEYYCRARARLTGDIKHG